jgi:ubiquinone/menaquinone biosynthesis C-methylase UbiE
LDGSVPSLIRRVREDQQVLKYSLEKACRNAKSLGLRQVKFLLADAEMLKLEPDASIALSWFCVHLSKAQTAFRKLENRKS